VKTTVISEFKKTVKQCQAILLLACDAVNIMLYGGSRSGKSFIIIYAIIVRACKEKSRHVILREKFNHAKNSIWRETLPKVLDLCFPELQYEANRSDFFLTLSNGSEIWVGGLDSKERTEKILGKEYSSIFFNECSQLMYESVVVALTRLAEKNGLKKKAYYDENPPSKAHWSYWLFIRALNPLDNEPVKNPENYKSMIMNPTDNLINIDENYLELLESMPEKQRKRFMEGIFVDADDGMAYYEFKRDEHVQEIHMDNKIGRVMIGMDFNVQPMTATIGYFTDKIFYVTNEAFLENSDTPKMCNELERLGVSHGLVYPDSTGRNRKTTGKSDFKILEDEGFTIVGTRNPFVSDRVININRLLKDNRIIIDPKCKKLINDLEKVSWKNNELDKKSDPMLTHISDALGYWCWSLDNIVYNSRKSSTKQL